MKSDIWCRSRFLAALVLGCSGLLSTAHADAPHAIGFQGAALPLTDVEVSNGNVYDYTFTTAPADWRVQSGVWEMTNRWDCSPGWSWFGGRSEEIAAVWHKRKFSGDFSVQFYFAFKMDFIKEAKATWHYHPQNVAISFCGDGKNLGSGYTFMMGADNNQRSQLLKSGKVVAESQKPEALLFSMADGYPAPELLHRRWWYAKVNRIGNRIECWLDSKLLFTYDDPKPIDAGQIALWTFNNGIMLSRVQVFYENEVKPAYKSRSLVTSPKNPPAKPTKVAKR
ncbi:MAG TPA: hypothetical protein VGB77_19355 [Abditibacteriaceae bacterium]|jgi:hypothetical protein